MESFGMEDGSQKKATSFGMIRRGNASDMEKMKPHFFRVMLDFMLQDAKIYIPTEFVKRYRSRLGSSVTLKVANGDTWEVELETDDEGLIWLVNGWEDFTKHHSLKQGDILVFRLEQDSCFHVMVFDPTASEKKYHCKHVKSLARMLNEVKVEQESDFGIGIGRKEVEGQGKLKQKKIKKGGGEEKRKEKLASPLKHVPTKLERPNHPSKTEIGMPEPRKGDASTSSVNPSFFLHIKRYNMNNHFAHLPADFVSKHMRPENHTVMVSGEDGSGPWALSYLVHRHEKRSSFVGGWATFRTANSLKVGDVCRFELISPDRMEVAIQRS